MQAQIRTQTIQNECGIEQIRYLDKNYKVLKTVTYVYDEYCNLIDEVPRDFRRTQRNPREGRPRIPVNVNIGLNPYGGIGLHVSVGNNPYYYGYGNRNPYNYLNCKQRRFVNSVTGQYYYIYYI